MNISQKFATAVGLSSVDEEHFEIVREFIKSNGYSVKNFDENLKSLQLEEK